MQLDDDRSVDVKLTKPAGDQIRLPAPLTVETIELVPTLGCQRQRVGCGRPAPHHGDEQLVAPIQRCRRIGATAQEGEGARRHVAAQRPRIHLHHLVEVVVHQPLIELRRGRGRGCRAAVGRILQPVPPHLHIGVEGAKLRAARRLQQQRREIAPEPLPLLRAARRVGALACSRGQADGHSMHLDATQGLGRGHAERLRPIGATLQEVFKGAAAFGERTLSAQQTGDHVDQAVFAERGCRDGLCTVACSGEGVDGGAGGRCGGQGRTLRAEGKSLDGRSAGDCSTRQRLGGFLARTLHREGTADDALGGRDGPIRRSRVVEPREAIRERPREGAVKLLTELVTELSPHLPIGQLAETLTLRDVEPVLEGSNPEIERGIVGEVAHDHLDGLRATLLRRKVCGAHGGEDIPLRGARHKVGRVGPLRCELTRNKTRHRRLCQDAKGDRDGCAQAIDLQRPFVVTFHLRRRLQDERNVAQRCDDADGDGSGQQGALLPQPRIERDAVRRRVGAGEDPSAELCVDGRLHPVGEATLREQRAGRLQLDRHMLLARYDRQHRLRRIHQRHTIETEGRRAGGKRRGCRFIAACGAHPAHIALARSALGAISALRRAGAKEAGEAQVAVCIDKAGGGVDQLKGLRHQRRLFDGERSARLFGAVQEQRREDETAKQGALHRGPRRRDQQGWME